MSEEEGCSLIILEGKEGIPLEGQTRVRGRAEEIFRSRCDVAPHSAAKLLRDGPGSSGIWWLFFALPALGVWKRDSNKIMHGRTASPSCCVWVVCFAWILLLSVGTARARPVRVFVKTTGGRMWL